MDVGRRRAPDPLGVGSPQDPFDGRALIPDETVGAEDDHAIRGVPDQRAEALLAPLQVDEQQSFGRGLVLQLAILTGQDPRGAAERQHDERGQHARGDEGDHEHTQAGRRDAFLDAAGILVDVVDADGIAVDHPSDRDEQLEIATACERLGTGPGVTRCVRGVGIDVAGHPIARIRAREQWTDRKALAAQFRRARVDDAPVARPDVDAADLAGQDQPLELGIDIHVARGIEVEARLVEVWIDVATHDRLDVLDRRLLCALAELVGDAVRDDDGHGHDDGDRRYDDERAETGSPWDAGEHAEDGSGIDARWHGARPHRTKDTLLHAMTDWYWNAALTGGAGGHRDRLTATTADGGTLATSTASTSYDGDRRAGRIGRGDDGPPRGGR